MPKITQSEYGPLKAFFVAWEERFPPSGTLPPEHHPVAVLESFERKGMSGARLGLGLAIGDTLEMSWDFPPGDIAAIDRDFAARGIVTLSELRRRYSRQFRGILKRGKYGMNQSIISSPGSWRPLPQRPATKSVRS